MFRERKKILWTQLKLSNTYPNCLKMQFFLSRNASTLIASNCSRPSTGNLFTPLKFADNPMVSPFIWNLLGRLFLWFYLFLRILEKEKIFFVAYVASVSVWFRSKERPRKGIFGFDSARSETRAKFFSSGLWLLSLVVCSEIKRKRLLRRVIFLWIDFLAIISQK